MRKLFFEINDGFQPVSIFAKKKLSQMLDSVVNILLLPILQQQLPTVTLRKSYLNSFIDFTETYSLEISFFNKLAGCGFGNYINFLGKIFIIILRNEYVQLLLTFFYFTFSSFWPTIFLKKTIQQNGEIEIAARKCATYKYS